ncbi:hypothetical protein KVR01_011024 [Diaporthe batatas]|uniref:uncharacterized protein n=1 Tax=Diaporthe batatas TaxID=748121 RepID=UPI001D044CD6|nr:uncharacterized protein KVR01_011024 [Diaporthe batatas]KAG8159363.1 hypothetical protein KVR01_011024 [Diaporthe batatas]
MADDHVLAKVHALSDVELACLLSLVNSEHCIVSTPTGSLDDLVTELQLITDRTFGLKSAVVECNPNTTLDDFASSLLLQPHASSPTTTRSLSPYLSRNPHDSYFPAGHVSFAHSPGRLVQSAIAPLTPQTPGPSHSQIANIVLAKNLDKAPRAVQTQALELLRTKRIFTRTSVQTAPKTFMLVAVLGADSGGEARVTQHLNDFFSVAHWVDPDEEGFPHIDGDDLDSISYTDDGLADDKASIVSTASVVKRRSRGRGTNDILHRSSPKPLAMPANATTPTTSKAPAFTAADISHLRQLSLRTAIDIDVLRYQMNIVSFLRMHRAVAGGITPQATRHLDQLVRTLAPLHGLEFVTPALVGVAARKVYLHRIKMVEASKERSMQWGSELGAIGRLLEGWGPEDVVEEVLAVVTAPV